jgi:hypothetical protein
MRSPQTGRSRRERERERGREREKYMKIGGYRVWVETAKVCKRICEEISKNYLQDPVDNDLCNV